MSTALFGYLVLDIERLHAQNMEYVFVWTVPNVYLGETVSSQL